MAFYIVDRLLSCIKNDFHLPRVSENINSLLESLLEVRVLKLLRVFIIKKVSVSLFRDPWRFHLGCKVDQFCVSSVNNNLTCTLNIIP